MTSFALPLNMRVASCKHLLAGKSQAGVGVANELYSGPVNAGKVYINRGLPEQKQREVRDERRVQTEASRNTRGQQKYQKPAEIQEYSRDR